MKHLKGFIGWRAVTKTYLNNVHCLGQFRKWLLSTFKLFSRLKRVGINTTNFCLRSYGTWYVHWWLVAFLSWHFFTLRWSLLSASVLSKLWPFNCSYITWLKWSHFKFIVVSARNLNTEGLIHFNQVYKWDSMTLGVSSFQQTQLNKKNLETNNLIR